MQWEVGGVDGGASMDAVVAVGGRGEVHVEEGYFGREGVDDERITTPEIRTYLSNLTNRKPNPLCLFSHETRGDAGEQR